MSDDLPRPLPDAALAYLAAFPAGRVTGFPITALDRTGVPVWVVALFLDDGPPGLQPSGIGYGATDGDAILGALGEIAEAVFPGFAMPGRSRTRGSYDELVNVHGADAVADPLTLCLPAGSPVDRATPLDWVEARRWATGTTVLVPLDLAASDLLELPGGYRPCTTPITNGLGAGPDLAWALGHGVLELLQRDGNGLMFRALDRGVVLETAGVGGAAGAMLERLRDADIDVLPKFASDQFGLANLYVVGRDRGSPRLPIQLSACGEACDPDPARALAKALTEFAAARVRKSFAHGPLGAARAVAPPRYVENFVARAKAGLAGEEGRALAAMSEWSRLDATALAGLLAGSVFRTAAHKPFADLPATPVDPPDSRTAGAIAIDRLHGAGFDVLVLDLSPPGAPVAVAKAIVPGLEVETMSYHRIGARGVAKLLDRDDPLIRCGSATDTLRPVRLTPEDAARLGRPLFDTALADRLVGGLYPLYREPEAHHVAWANGEVIV